MKPVTIIIGKRKFIIQPAERKLWSCQHGKIESLHLTRDEAIQTALTAAE